MVCAVSIVQVPSYLFTAMCLIPTASENSAKVLVVCEVPDPRYGVLSYVQVYDTGVVGPVHLGRAPILERRLPGSGGSGRSTSRGQTAGRLWRSFGL